MSRLSDIGYGYWKVLLFFSYGHGTGSGKVVTESIVPYPISSHSDVGHFAVEGQGEAGDS